MPHVSGNIGATQKGVFTLKGIKEPVTIYRCLKDWPTRLGADSYPAVIGPIAIPTRSPTHLSRPDSACPQESQGSRLGLSQGSRVSLKSSKLKLSPSKQSLEVSGFAPSADPSVDELTLDVMVMRANNEESAPAYLYSEYSVVRQSPGAHGEALAPSVGSPCLPTKLTTEGSERHESRSDSYDHLGSPELPLPPVLTPGERSSQHLMGRKPGLPVLVYSHSMGGVHRKSQGLGFSSGGSSGVARVAKAKSSLGPDASLGPSRSEDCVGEKICSQLTSPLTEGTHDDGDSSDDEAELEELFRSGSGQADTAESRDSRKSSRNRLLNNLLPTMSRQH
eukprot:gene10501-8468_t